VLCDQHKDGDKKSEQKEPQQALAHGDYPLAWRPFAPGRAAGRFLRDARAVAQDAVIGGCESIGSGITKQDKRPIVERNPFGARLAPGSSRQD
jgi:hypothetical protein